MIALLKYGTGVPFKRLERLQEQLGMPLPATTQWDLMAAAAQPMRPALEELIRQAAQGSVMHNDDTSMRILRLTREPGDKRTGTFTSGIVSLVGAWTIALFFTGWKHAGENLADVLKQRAGELPAPIQMCDALSRNTPKGVETLIANCLAHGRRQIVEVVENFPEECRYVLETLGGVYHYDALAREQELSPEERLRFHQEHSGPLMKGLHEWMEAQLAEHKTEPNSGLGKAISYLLNHWPKLTLFLRQPGAPLDNNIVERALKKAILNRKNALFYKTLNGAGVGDLFMSLIHTCELNGANPFDYLTELQRHAEELKRTSIGVDALELPRDAGAARRRPPPRNMMSPAWPKRILCGHGWVTLRNAHKTGLSKDKIGQRFWPVTETVENVPGRVCMPAFPPMISRHFRCRAAPCGSMLPGAAGRSPCKSVR